MLGKIFVVAIVAAEVILLARAVKRDPAYEEFKGKYKAWYFKQQQKYSPDLTTATL